MLVSQGVRGFSGGSAASTRPFVASSNGVPTITLRRSRFALHVSAAQGGYNVKEAYAELLIPVLKDLPFAPLAEHRSG